MQRNTTEIFKFLLFSLFFINITSYEGYDKSNCQFHPTGRVLLTEYAKEVVNKFGSPVSGLKCSDGIIISTLTQKLKNNSLLKRKQKKAFIIDKHICIAVSGALQQVTSIIKLSKQLAAEYYDVYNSPIPVETLCDKLSDIMHSNTRNARTTPIAIGLMIAGWDDLSGSQLYTVDPEGL